MSNYPAILYDSILTDYPNEYTGQVTEWMGMLTINHDAGTDVTCSAIGLARHSLTGQGVTVWYSTNGSTYNTAGVFYPTPGKTFFGLFEQQTARYWRVTIPGLTGFTNSFAVIKLGQALRLQRTIYGGVTPPRFNQTGLKVPQVLQRGQFLNRHTYAKRVRTTYRSDTITGSWARTNLVPLQDHVLTGGGVFYLWRPDDYPDSAVYGFIPSGIQFSNAGPRDFMSVEFEVSGIT
ncbi:MAG: hypothetical protein D6711_13775 [Chloroflexi bacterium]|nr:MAG: hypothetical protein D6711_13775 [Chloroflexota bacterium]